MSVDTCKVHVYSRQLRVEVDVKGGVLVSELPLSLPRLEPCLLWRRVRQNCLHEYTALGCSSCQPAVCCCCWQSIFFLSSLLPFVPLPPTPASWWQFHHFLKSSSPFTRGCCSVPVILLHLLTSELRLHLTPPPPGLSRLSCLLAYLTTLRSETRFLTPWEQNKLALWRTVFCCMSPTLAFQNTTFCTLVTRGRFTV